VDERSTFAVVDIQGAE